MAVAKTARVMSTQRFGPDTLLLDLFANEPLGFVGGQYLILNSGIVLRDGKTVKRAYSVLTSDENQRHVQLAVKHIPGGFGSAFVHGLAAGMDVSFSGPWGRFVPPASVSGRTLIVATDTGITAALGFLKAARFAPALPQTLLIWMRASEQYFLPDEFVRGRVHSACGEVRIEGIPEVGHPDRLSRVRAILGQVLPRGEFAQAFMAGDGVVNRLLLDDLAAAGVSCGSDHVESFFNIPKKSV